MTYETFLTAKTQLANQGGFNPLWIPEFLFDFQRHLVEWAIQQGRGAIFADCGLGKTPMSLVWAENIIRKTNKPVLMLTPIAVGIQTVGEGEKFGVEVHRSIDGTVKPNITVTNYERLHLFNPDDFSGVVCDECFPAGTKIDTPLGLCDIETLRQGDYILNASGVDTISNIHRREVQYAVAITISSQRITASPNHPIFTQRGWVAAQDLEPGDSILQTAEAVRMVRGDVSSSSVSGFWTREILREILLSEMAHESAAVSCEGTHAGSCREARREEASMVCCGEPEGYSRNRAHQAIEPHEQSRSTPEGLQDIETHEAQTFRAWRKRDGYDDSAESYAGCTRQWVGKRIEYIVGTTESGLSHSLQAGLSQRRAQSRYRSGWALPSFAQGTGSQEGCDAGFARVDSLEILEPGHPELERLRDAEGKLYFYDLSATRHPSYSIGGLLVHNSSILKHFSGATQKAVTRFLSKIPYRLLCTATAAPNDYVELGTSSEALGGLGYSDVLSRFFVMDDKARYRMNDVKAARAANHNYFAKLSYRIAQTIGQWRLKGHAEEPFWRWVASWAMACRKPSDLGFPDNGFLLPPLQERQHVITPRDPGDGYLFTLPAVGLHEERMERRRTLKERCELVAELATHREPAIIWCHTNEEGLLLAKLIPDAVEVAGRHADEQKEEAFTAFTNQQIRALITKPKIGAWGMNWQHCAHVITFASHSYEQYYQSIRRCLRFGQVRPVTVDVVATTGEQYVIENMMRKAHAMDQMFASLTRHMRNAMALSGSSYTRQEEFPSWLLPTK